MTDPIERLRAVGEGATARPWTYGGPQVLARLDGVASPTTGEVTMYQDGHTVWVCKVPTEEFVRNGPFIATARNVWEELVAVAREAPKVHQPSHDGFGRVCVCGHLWPCPLGDALAVLRSKVESLGETQ